MKLCPSHYFSIWVVAVKRGHLFWFTLQLEVKNRKCLQLKASQGSLLWHLQSGGCGCAAGCEGAMCGLWRATLYPCGALLGAQGWQHKQSSQSDPQSWACCCASTSALGLESQSELRWNRTSHTITLYNLQMCIIFSKWVVPLPLKWCIWVFEDGGSRSVQSILNQSVFEPVLSKGLQYYVHISRRRVWILNTGTNTVFSMQNQCPKRVVIVWELGSPKLCFKRNWN